MTLEQLAQRITQLEERLGASSLAPNAFSLNSKGELEEHLSGTLEAKGIIMPATVGVGSESQIRWKSSNGGALIAEMHGSIDGGHESGRLTLGAFYKYQEAGVEAAEIEIDAFEGISLKVLEDTQSARATLLNAAGESSFLQAAGALSKLQISAGEGIVNWKSGVGGCAIAHGLGVIPRFAIATLTEGLDIFYDTSYIGITEMNATNADFAWGAINGVKIEAGRSAMRWVAIG